MPRRASGAADRWIERPRGTLGGRSPRLMDEMQITKLRALDTATDMC